MRINKKSKNIKKIKIMKTIEVLKEKVSKFEDFYTEVKGMMKDSQDIYVQKLKKGLNRREKILVLARLTTSTIINLGSLWVIFNMTGWIQYIVLSLVIFGIVWKYLIFGGILIGYHRFFEYYKEYFKALVA